MESPKNNMMVEAKQTNPSPSADDHAAAGGDDLISCLYDDVLFRILGHVRDARDVARTGALSRRWRGLWARGVPALRFDSGPEFQSPGDAQRFVAIVDHVLAPRGAKPAAESPIKLLEISMNVNYAPGEQPQVTASTAEAIQGWVRHVVRQKLTSFAFQVQVMPKKWTDKFIQEPEYDDNDGSENSDYDGDDLEEDDNDDDLEEDDDDDDLEDDDNGNDDLEEDEEEEEEEVLEEKEEEEEHNYGGDEAGDDDTADETPVIALDDLASNDKLETMRLLLVFASIRVRLPTTSVTFTSLTDLSLECLEIAADIAQLGRLVSSPCCPRLQKLRLHAVSFEHAATTTTTKKELVLETSTLMELTIQYMLHEMESLELRAPNLLDLTMESCDELKKLVVSASRLRQLTFSQNCVWGDDIHVDLMPRVRRLRIDLVSHMRSDSDINDACISLLKSCSSATCLEVDLEIPSSKFERHADLIEYKIPLLPNVTSLAVKIDSICERHSFGDGVASLLTRLHNLEHLSLQLNEASGWIKRDEYFSGDSASNHEDRWIFSDIHLAKLLKAEFRGLTGTFYELRFLRFMLENATELEKVTVRFSVNNHYLDDSWIDIFLHGVLEEGSWIACEDKSYVWSID